MYFEFVGFSAQCNFLRRQDKRPITVERRTIDRGEFLDFFALPPVSSSLLVSPAAGYPAFSKYERVQERERGKYKEGIGKSVGSLKHASFYDGGPRGGRRLWVPRPAVSRRFRPTS